MLKQLIGQWKAHRKKPTLLPEETEVHFEESTTVNPLFEDNESAVTSEALGELAAVIDSIALDLDRGLSDSGKSGSEDTLIDINGESSHKLSLGNSKKISEEQESVNEKDTKSSFVKENVGKVENVATTADKLPIESNAELSTSDSGLENDTSLKPNKSFLASLSIVPKKIDFPKHISLSDKSLLSEPESTLPEKQVPSEKPPKDDQVPSTSSDPSEKKILNIEKNEKVIDAPHEKVDEIEKNIETSTEMILKIQEQPLITTPSKVIDKPKHIFSPSNLQSSQNKFEKVNGLPVISELIKKFQSQENAIAPKSENIPFLEPKTSFKTKQETVAKTLLNEQTSAKGVVKSFSSEQTATKVVEKESLSKIFNFPPPPPAEPQRIVTKQKEAEKSFSATTCITPNVNNTLAKGITRSDSSLSRNKTISPKVKEVENLTVQDQVNPPEKDEGHMGVTDKFQHPTSSKTVEVEKTTTDNVVEKKPSKKVDNLNASRTESTIKYDKTDDSSAFEKENRRDEKLQPSIDIVPSTSRETSSSPNSILKQTVVKTIHSISKQNQVENSSPPTKKEKVEETSGSVQDTKTKEITSSEAEVKPAKNQSEDSAITRGDQISSEATQDNPKLELEDEPESVHSKTVRRSKRERKLSHNRSKKCKDCLRTQVKNSPLKRGKCDVYYDVITGARGVLQGKHSESWGSDLSYEEKELIRKLRSRKETSSSGSFSKKSRRSQRLYPENGYFHRAHNLRRSISDESSFPGSSSMCSCDDCWLMMVKDYAYGRASLRGDAPKKAHCTCRPLNTEFLSRKVKFRSDPIPEMSTMERNMTTPSIPEEGEKRKDVDSSDNSKKTASEKGDTKKCKNKDKRKTSTDSKILKEKYRLVTPWELEEWDMAMKRHILSQRRKRARNMGLIALAMVIFIGLVVTIVLVYLRRKTL